MMIKMVYNLLHVGFLLAGFLIFPSACQTKCLMYLDEVKEILGSKVPPINDSRMTDNYYNISRALYPSVHLPALYVKVTIQFLKDYQNGTKIIDDQEDNLKYTWSKACSYVSVKHLSLYAMSVFSLFTIHPQRRESELIVTVPPFCRSSPHVTNDDTNETWRYVVATLEDIIINPKISDPRLNTACCVVKGHEGDIAEYPNVWFFYWFILVSSFFASFSLWILLLQFISDNMDEDLKDNRRRVCGAALKMTSLFTILMFILDVLSVPILIDFKTKTDGKMYIYFGAYIVFWLVSFIIGCVCHCKCFSTTECARNCEITYVIGTYCLFPCLFQTVHHFLWMICGIISDPFWAIPVFLLECLFLVSILFAFFLYENEDIVKNPSRREHKFKLKLELGTGCVLFHLVMCVVSFTLVLITIALIAVNNGNAVASPTAGAIETAMTVIFIWLVKNSSLDFRKQTAVSGQSTPPAPSNNHELQPLNP